MKKIIALAVTFTLICTAAFSRNFFSGRFFEIKTGAQVGLSNNLITGNDIFQKELVIDLKKLADDCPDGGMSFIANAVPAVELNLNIAKFHLGVSAGAEMYGKFNIGKDLFDFAGYGNSLGEELNLSFTAVSDVFAYSQLDVGFDSKKFKLHFKPAIFAPIIATRGNGGTVKFSNSADHLIDAEVEVNMQLYSPIEFENTSKYFDEVMSSGNILNSSLFNGYGMDFGTYLAWPLSKSFSVDFDLRFPIVPGHLKKVSTVTAKYSYKVDSISDLAGGEKEGEGDEKKDNFTQEEPKFSALEDCDFKIHRPLKFDVYLDKNLLGNLFNARAGAGFGIRHPMSDEAEFYPEYYLGLTLNLIDLFKLGVSTEYTDQIFKHQIGTTFSLRFIQLDVGANVQSSSFKKSMEVAGLGAYAYFTVGF